MYPEGATYVSDFNGGNGPLNRQLEAWRQDGWIAMDLTRQGGNRWDIVLRCGTR